MIVRRLDIEPEEVLCVDWMWSYEAIVTTFDWNGEDVWHFHNFRCNAENHIKEAKYGFAMDQFSSHNFGANQAAQALKLLAYNLPLLYKQTMMKPVAQSWIISRIRRRLFFSARRADSPCKAMDTSLSSVCKMILTGT